MPYNFGFLWNLEIMGAQSRIVAIRDLMWVFSQWEGCWFKGIKLQLDKRPGPCDVLRSIEGMIRIVENNMLYFKSYERVGFKCSQSKDDEYVW